MKRNLLLTPGPTQVPPRILQALGRPIIHHRTPKFQEYLKEAVAGLQEVFQTRNDVYILAGSGTAAMEASVCNLLSAGDKAVTVEAGKFGERWTEICKAYGVNAHAMKVANGKDVDPAQLRSVLAADKDIKTVFITLTETSTGVTADVEAIGKIVKETNAVLVVDAVSGLGVTDLKSDAWSVDIVASASHKGLMLPPGLAFVSVSAKAFAMIEKNATPRYYFDLRKYKKAAAKTDTPFTPAIGLVIALVDALKMVKESGLENLFAHYARLAKGTRAAANALGLKLLADETCISNVVTPILLPEGVDGEKVVKRMRDTYGISVAGGQGEDLKGKIIRIAHMGSLDEYDIIAGISCLEKVLKEMGHSFTLGAGVSAAQKHFNS
ncbi:MAG: alanine--glyoxylate aminotransferase family protein [Candidatus Omnitrophota bacterium]|nr:alanine--glyoxylate aminotransferase family protein [Candidatus Omnitrophota bacterium]MDZ4242486.1 alanine--glyoxylate aminotransferase family protein [Candidatus Omnitrophota bacterium]